MNSQNEVNKMLNIKKLWPALLVSYFLAIATANADSLQDYVVSKLDGQGTVDSINAAAKQVVINDRSYVLSSNVTVFDVKNRRNSSVGDIKVGDSVGFKSKALSEPTAPYDQLIIKMWILPSTN